MKCRDIGGDLQAVQDGAMCLHNDSFPMTETYAWSWCLA